MPNVRAITLNSLPDLVSLVTDRGTFTVTQAEAQAWLDGHPAATDAQIEAQIVTLIQSRWTGREDTVAVHLRNRTPIEVTVFLAAPGTAIPPVWW